MVTARTLKGAQVYVTFYPDCEENVGGYYCQVYTDENRQFHGSCERYCR